MSQNTKNMLLTEILTPEQCGEVVRICETQDDDDIVKHLKAYLNQFREQLEAKGVLPDYLAYYLYAKHIGAVR